MATGSILRLTLLCLGVFTSILVSLQLYFLAVDEENSIPFSQTEFGCNIFEDTPGREDCEKASRTSSEIIDDEVLKDIDENYHAEENEPFHFHYGADQHSYKASSAMYKHAQHENLPIMIWWTHFAGGDTMSTCNEGKCYITENRALQNDLLTRAFLFYGTDFDGNDLPLPRKADDEWALFHEESPKNNPILFHEDTIMLFNHTSTFRRYSDYPLFTQCLESISVLETAPWYTLEAKNADKDSASVVYVQSGCNPPSDRDAYVQELMKYIKVDSFGRCLNNKELPDKYKDSLTFEDKGFFKFVAKYKFTLVFENAICDDYLTEKIWRPLEVGSVPIYKGSPSILDWMPNNHSIILVDDFPSPKDLSEFIKEVDADDSLYLNYLKFKRKGGVTNTKLLEHMKHRPWGVGVGDLTFVSGFECFVCDRLHKNIKRQKAGLPIVKHFANQQHFGCPRPVLFDLPPPRGTEQFERDMWTQEYDEYIPISKDMNKAVLSGHKTFNYSKSWT